MINFYCPDFYLGEKFYIQLLQWQKEIPEVFNENVNIKTIFGSFPNMLWNGGSIFKRERNAFETEIIKIKNIYEKLNIPLQLTLTNSQIKEEHLKDEYCNKILKIMNNGLNEVLVSNNIMEEYIKNNYPNYKINRSIVNTAKDYNWEEALKIKYNNIVLPYRHLENFDILNSIDKKYRNRIEILCNDRCPRDCNRYCTHHMEFEKITLNIEDEDTITECTNEKIKNNILGIDFSSQITYKDIINKYLPLGYTEFKLAGRTNYVDIVCSVIDYFIKPDYKCFIIRQLL